MFGKGTLVDMVVYSVSALMDRRPGAAQLRHNLSGSYKAQTKALREAIDNLQQKTRRHSQLEKGELELAQFVLYAKNMICAEKHLKLSQNPNGHNQPMTVSSPGTGTQGSSRLGRKEVPVA